LYKKQKNLFSSTITNFQSFALLYFFITLIVLYYFVSLVNWSTIDLRFIIFPVLLLFPIALFGFEKIIHNIFNDFQISNPVFSIIIIVLVVSLLVFTMDNKYSYVLDTYFIKTNSELSKVNDRIEEIVSGDQITASNYSTEVWLKTGIKSISLPHQFTNQDDFEKYLMYYDISYLIFYNINYSRYHSNLSPLIIMNFDSSHFIYQQEIIGGSSIIKVKDIYESDPTHLIPFVYSMEKLNWLGKINQTNTIFNDLRNYNSNNKIELEICRVHTLFGFFDESIYKCNKILEKDPENQIAAYYLAISYLGIDDNKVIQDKIKTLVNLERYNEALILTDSLLKFYPTKIDYHIENRQFDEVNKKQQYMLDLLDKKISILLIFDDDNETFRTYLDMLDIDKFSSKPYFGIAKYYEKRGELKIAIHNYELAFQFDQGNVSLLEKIADLKKKMQ